MAYNDTGSIIRQQLGGRQFDAMTGARSWLAIGRVEGAHFGGVQFDLPARFAQDGINRVRVTLLASDLYRVEFISYRPRTLREVMIYRHVTVYADGLRAVFTRRTGLDCGGVR